MNGSNADDKMGKMTFSVFVAGLMAEGLMAMGVMEHPEHGKVAKNLSHAEMVIDTLAMLKEKTAGNLAQEEEKYLEQVIHQMRIAYVECSKDPGKEEIGADNEK